MDVEQSDYLKNRVTAVVLNPEEKREIGFLKQIRTVAEASKQKTDAKKQQKYKAKQKLKAKENLVKEKKAKENRKRAFKEISKYEKTSSAKRHRGNADI